MSGKATARESLRLSIRGGDILYRFDYVEIECCALLKGLVKRDFAQLGAHRRLRELHNGSSRIFDTIRSPPRVYNLHTSSLTISFCLLRFGLEFVSIAAEIRVSE